MNSNKKKILIFSTAYYPFLGGAEVAVKEITDRLSDDFEFDLITAKMDKNLLDMEKIGAVSVYRVGFGKPFIDKILLPWMGAFLTFKLYKNRRYSLFWGIMVSYSTGGAFIFNVCRKILGKPKVPIVLTLQEGDSESHLNYKWAGMINMSWRMALRQTDLLTALSSFLLHRAERFGYTGPKELVPNGVSLSLFSGPFDPKEKNEIEENLGKKDGDVFLVTVSRLTHKNAVDDIISALTFLPDNISLVVIGIGEEGYKLQTMAEKNGVAKRVKFLGFVPHNEIPKYLSVCDVFIRPSRSEGFGNSFIEAMAAGLPVIATPVGGIPDFVDDKVTGFFCSPDNPQSIAKTVSFILENGQLVEEVKLNALKRVVARYDWSLIAEKMKNKVFGIID